ncbi:MAG: hydroxyacid dehydrogenase [Planctomycetota bacterium]
MSESPEALIVMNPDALGEVYDAERIGRVAERVNLLSEPVSAEVLSESPEWLARVEVMLTGWGVPRMDTEFLVAAPRLRGVFHGAGSVRSFVTDAVWDRGLTVTSAASANAVPVAQFCQAQVFLLLKQAYKMAGVYADQRVAPWRLRDTISGAVGARVGLISFGLIARLLAEALRPHGFDIVVYDPFVSDEVAKDCGVKLVDLDTVFATSDVVSLHTPLLDETRGMIRGEHLRSMRSGSSFLNTARGAVVNEPEMCDVLAERPDLTAVLDVTHPEPPSADSPLWTLPNVVLTPHIAGALGRECGRLGEHAVTQLFAYLDNRPIDGLVTQTSFQRMA